MAAKGMKVLLASMLALFVLAAGFQAWQRSAPAAAPAPTPEAASRVALAPGEEIALADGARLRFVRLVSDSRCPMDAMCIVQGDAVLDFEMESDGGTSHVQVRFDGEPAATDIGDHTLVATQVRPYPMASQPADPGDYRVSVELFQQ